MESWILRDEIIKIINKWYLALIIILIGGVAGFAISYIIPAPYRATADLYVGIDVTRVNEMEYLIPLASTEPLNLDDYKNWQLKQVSAILSSDQVLLNSLDSLGNPVDLSTFKQDLDLYWYDAGLWQLESVNTDKELAKAAVRTWLEEGHQRISELLVFSDIAASLDAKLFALAGEIGTLKTRSANLISFQSSAAEWVDVFSNQNQDQPLNEETLVELKAWILAHRENDQHWQVPIGEFPNPQDPAADYLQWLENALIYAEEDYQVSQVKLSILEEERELVLPDYHKALVDSLGLSANLVLEPLSSEIEISRFRSTGEMTIGGGIAGLLAWLILAVMKISQSKKSND